MTVILYSLCFHIENVDTGQKMQSYQTLIKAIKNMSSTDINNNQHDQTRYVIYSQNERL